MPRQKVDVRFPFAGISDDVAYSSQRERTTRNALNMRGIDPDTGRVRGGQRSGLTRYLPPQLSGGNKVQALAKITTNNTLLTYAKEDNPELAPATVWSETTTYGGVIVDIKTDAYGNVYVADHQFGVVKYTPEGTKLQELAVPEDGFAASNRVTACAIDAFQNVYIATGMNDATGTAAKSRLYCFKHEIDDSYGLAWELDSGVEFCDVAIHQSDIITLEGGNVGDTAGTLRVRYGMAQTLEAPAVTADVSLSITPSSGAGNDYARRMSVRQDGIVYVAYSTVATTTGVSAAGGVAKMAPYADTPAQVWQYENDGYGGSNGGVGYGVAVGPVTDAGYYTVYCYGPRADASGDDTTTAIARRLVDKGTTVSDSGGDGAWFHTEASGGEEPIAGANFMCAIRLVVDDDGTVYVPFNGLGSQQSVIILDSAGTAEYAAFDMSERCTSVALPPEPKPSYEGADVATHEFLYLGGQNDSDRGTIYKKRLLSVTQSGSAMRTQNLVGACNGNIVNFTTTSTGAPTNGADALDSSAPYIQATTLFEKVYFVDGKNNKVWDPSTGTDGTVSDWLGDASGSMVPKRCRLVEQWRGRMVLAADPEDPQNWHMSAVEAPGDWNAYPEIPNAKQAVSGISARAGRVPDIINCIVPYSDDMMLFGGDKSIWRMTGDPMSGGQLDLVTDETGMGWGRPYTKDPDGVLYFYGSRGSIYRWEPGSAVPQRLSRYSIERRIQDLDQSDYYARLVWSTRDEGLHVFQVPFNDTAAAKVKHWFWESKTEAWWEDEFASANVQPASAMIIDGDQGGDRTVLIGGLDGRVRYFDTAATDDDTFESDRAIDSYVDFGPIVGAGPPGELIYQHPEVWLANNQGGAHMQLLGGDEPEDQDLKHERPLHPGRNGPMLVQARADQIYMRLRNATTGERWAFEKAAFNVASGGMRRSR